MNCQYCNSPEVIRSGVDAFLLGAEVEKTCYTCANARKAL